jgi:hypothetical protein
MFGIKSLSDLKYIIPTFAEVLTVARSEMSDNDYLLTAVILCQPNSQDDTNYNTDVTKKHFNRYIISEPFQPSGYSSS